MAHSNHTHPIEKLTFGDPLVETIAVTCARVLHQHPNMAGIVVWSMRVVLYLILGTVLLTAFHGIARMPHMGTSMAWCLSRAALVVIVTGLALSFLCWYPLSRKFVQQQLPWSVLLIAMAVSVESVKTSRATSCRAPFTRGAVSVTPRAAAPTSAVTPTTDATVETVLRADLDRVLQAMVAEHARTNVWPSTIPLTVQASAGVQLGMQLTAMGFAATAAAPNGQACGLELTVTSPTDARKDVRCGRAAR